MVLLQVLHFSLYVWYGNGYWFVPCCVIFMLVFFGLGFIGVSRCLVGMVMVVVLCLLLLFGYILGSLLFCMGC